MQTRGESALHVAKNLLDQREVGFVTIMHEEAHLLNSICQIWSNRCEILKSTGETPVLRPISSWSVIRGQELGLSVNMCRRGGTLGHAGTSKEVHGVLALR